MPASFTVPPLRLRNSRAALLLALAMVAALALFFVREVADLRQSMDQQRLHDSAQIQIRTILVNLLDAETGQRGYIMTGDDNYLDPYRRGKGRIRESLAQAENSGIRDRRFLQNVRQLMLLTEMKLSELDLTITLKRRSDGDGAMAVVAEGSGRATMRQARAIIDKELELLQVERERILVEFNYRLRRAAIILVTMLTAVVCLAIQAWRSVSASARDSNDIAQRLALEASHDALTGLPNRRFFERWTRMLVAKSQREPRPFTLLLIDLDGFKKVNDTLGHGAGDDVLQEAAARLQRVLRTGEFLARLGGDEFGLVLEGAVSRAETVRVGERLIESLKHALHPELRECAVGASIGVASFPANGTDLESLIEAADQALYQSKDAGRGMVSFSSRIYVRRTPAQALAPIEQA